MRNLLNENKINKKYIKNNKIIRLNKSFEQNKLVSSEINIIKKESIGKNNNSYLVNSYDNQLNLSINNLKKNKSNSMSIDTVFVKLNYLFIFKSFLCFKDKKSKLINLCHNYIIEDMSIEKLLERLYNLESYNKYYQNDEKYNIIQQAKFKKINQYISDIYNQLEIEINLKNKKIENI